jgi:hypothetical protein
VIADVPQVSRARHCRSRTITLRDLVCVVGVVPVQVADEKIDFGGFEASHGDVKLEMNRKLLKFERKKCPIPTSIFGEPVSNHIRPDLSGRQMVDSHGRDIAHPKELCRLDSAVSGDYSIGGVDQDRIDETELCDARRDLPDLPSSMRPWILCPRLELAGVFIDDLQCSHVPPYRRRRRPVTHPF